MSGEIKTYRVRVMSMGRDGEIGEFPGEFDDVITRHGAEYAAEVFINRFLHANPRFFDDRCVAVEVDGHGVFDAVFEIAEWAVDISKRTDEP